MPRLALLLTLLVAAPATADDEISEHTAELAGDPADTAGVTIEFDKTAGWSMTAGAQPIALALPMRHAHYVVYVTPGRQAVAFVETSAGYEAKRLDVAPKDKLAWVWSPKGKLVRSWTYGDVFSKAELKALRRTTSHVMWNDSHAVTPAGLELVVGKRTIVLDPKARRLR